MAFAYGYGGHMGGLMFLNFLGTLLFFVFIFMMVKFIFRGARYGWAGGGGCNSAAKGDWSGRKARMHEYFKDAKAEQGSIHDEANMVIRERLAKGDINAQDYEALKEGLKVSADEPSFDKAQRLARLRYANGEITQEEFDAVKKALKS